MTSNCCHAPAVVVGRTTLHYQCSKCGKPCDATATVETKPKPATLYFCDCGAPSVKRTSSGRVCQRCLKLELRYYGRDKCGRRRSIQRQEHQDTTPSKESFSRGV